MADTASNRDDQSPLDALLDAAPRGAMRHWLSLVFLAVAALGTLAFFVRFVAGDDSPYYTAPVERGDLVPRVSERGQARGSGEVTVAATMPGTVTWVTGKTGGKVVSGEVLAVLDAAHLASGVAIARSRVTVAQASLNGAKISAEDTSARLARFENVWRRSGGRAPSLNEMENARVDARQAEIGVEAARAGVRTAARELKDQQVQMTRAEVRAPIAGTLVMSRVQVGQSVATNQPLFTIAAELAPLTIELPVTNRPDAPIKMGSLAQVRFDAIPNIPQSARLTPMPGDPQRVVFTIERPDSLVRPGMAATVEIDLPERRNVLLVPDAALAFEPVDRQERQQGKRRERIYVLDHGDPRRVYVTVGGSDGKHAEVFANDLEPGEQAIIGWRAPSRGSKRSRP